MSATHLAVIRGLCLVGVVVACTTAGLAATTVLNGMVVAAEDGAAIGGARISIEGLDLAATSGPDGCFELPGLPAPSEGTAWSVTVHASGYLQATVPVPAMPWPPAKPLVVRLDALAYELDALTVHGDLAAGLIATHQRTLVIDAADLQRRRDGTLAAALDGEAGLARQSMGPGAERPVLRGLGGHRLPVYSDQTPTGDLSATAPDHALVVEPLLVQQVAVVRGPATLQYSGGSPAGLLDVRSGNILEQRLDRLELQAGARLATVNDGRAGQLRLGAPLGPLGLQVDLAGRRSADLRTPSGTLGNTQQDSWQGSLGLSVAGATGFVGGALGRVEADYGIPGGFLGGHPGGVSIELERTRLEMRGEHRPDLGPFDRLEAQFSYSRYTHRELESSGVCGVSFGQLTYQGAARARLRSLGLTVGASLEHRDLAMACLSFLPPTVETTPAVFLVDEAAVGRGRLTTALRWEGRVVSPDRADSNKAGRIRERRFGGLAAAAAFTWPDGAPLSWRAQVVHTFRPPAIEELFAEGPHLAAYSYEIGNADLGAERGVTVEVGGAWKGARGEVVLTVFRSDLDRYIYAADTGELEWGPGEDGFLARYQQRGRDASMLGAELTAAWRPAAGWHAGLVMAHVQGSFRDDDRPMPRVPPASGRLELRREVSSWSAGAVVRGALAQRRLGEFEEATTGYLAGDLWVQRHWLVGGHRHGLVLRVDNLTDAAYRNHLSRLKSIRPEAGRGVSLAYRLDL